MASNLMVPPVDKPQTAPADRRAALILFRLFLVAVALVLAVLLYFFAVGLTDGSVSSFNLALWLGLLAAVATCLGGAVILHRQGRRGAATVLLGLVAVPGIGFGLFLLLMLMTQPRWN